MTSADVLLITGISGADSFADVLAQQLGMRVEVASTPRAGLQSLRRGEFAVIVVEENLAENDPEWADQVWEHAGLAIPVQVNFSISGCARLGREVKSALARRAGEQAIARKAAVMDLEDELKSSITGLLLQSELALREPDMPAELAPKLRRLVELAGDIRHVFDLKERKP